MSDYGSRPPRRGGSGFQAVNQDASLKAREINRIDLPQGQRRQCSVSSTTSKSKLFHPCRLAACSVSATLPVASFAELA